MTLHLIGGLVLLALLCVQAVQRTQGGQRLPPVGLSQGMRSALLGHDGLARLRKWFWAAGSAPITRCSACTTFPKCQGSWWPAMDFAQGFQIWRELGMLQDGSHISFAGLTAIHYVHRLMAYVVLAAMVWLALQLRPSLKAQAHWLFALAALQLATGLSNVVLDWPLLAAVLHTGGLPHWWWC